MMANLHFGLRLELGHYYRAEGILPKVIFRGQQLRVWRIRKSLLTLDWGVSNAWRTRWADGVASLNEWLWWLPFFKKVAKLRGLKVWRY